jgi:hypothetical protein
VAHSKDLAALYGVETRVLLQAVKRNAIRFPGDFMLQITASEWAALKSHFVTIKPGRGQHCRYLPDAFAEQGVASEAPRHRLHCRPHREAVAIPG